MFRTKVKTTQPRFEVEEGSIDELLEQLREWRSEMVRYANAGHPIEADDFLIDVFNTLGYLMDYTQGLSAKVNSDD